MQRNIGVMDLAAAVLCMQNKIPMKVFGLNEKDSIIQAVQGDSTGTIITVE